MKSHGTVLFLLGVIAGGVSCLALLALADRFPADGGEPFDAGDRDSPYGGPDDPLDASGDVPFPLPVTVI